MHLRSIQSIQKILLISISIFVFSGCVNVVVEAVPEPTLDLSATAVALLSETEAEKQPDGSNAVPIEKPPVQMPSPSATKYIPEGQLLFYNFDDLQEGTETEIRSGITLSKPRFGFVLTLTGEDNYFVGAGLQNHPNGNVSIYALNISDPADATAVIGCRLSQALREDGDTGLGSGYLAELRFDGYARLVKRTGKGEIVLGDWKSGIPINPEGVFNQLYLLCDGSRLLFMVNADVVYDLQDAELQDGDFFFGLKKPEPGGSVSVHFDKFTVYEP